MYKKLVSYFFNKISHGQIRLTDGDKHQVFGSPNGAPPGEIWVQDKTFYRNVVHGGAIGFGEAYTAGYWTSPNLVHTLSVLATNQKNLTDHQSGWGVLKKTLDILTHRNRKNTRENSKRNIREHYDLSNAFYATFLDDATWMYSAGIFKNPDESLEEAQYHKINRMIQQADIQSHHHVLEIGSGWGGFAIEAARQTGCKVTTITLSEAQYELAVKRIQNAGLEDQITIALCDYRDVKGQFDRIVSIEMLEAVGHEFIPTFFKCCASYLKPHGRLVLQVITIPHDRYDTYRKNVDWIRKHIFPGGHLPSYELLEEVSRAYGFSIQDQLDIGLDYAQTLACWHENVLKNKEQIIALGFDETFIRKWRFYLAYCEAGFRTQLLHDFQLTLQLQ